VPTLNNSSQKSYRIRRFHGRLFDVLMEAGFIQSRRSGGLAQSENPKTKGILTMRCMVIVKADKDSEAGLLPTKKTKETFAAMGKFNEELVRAGVMLAGEGLQPSSKGKRVRFSGKQRTVIDGPFAETKELIGGFWLWQVKSMEEAVEWLKRAPFDGGTEVEIRQVYEVSDFPADVLPPEDAAREQALRDELQKRAAKR